MSAKNDGLGHSIVGYRLLPILTMEINRPGLEVRRGRPVAVAVGSVTGGAALREDIAGFIPRVLGDSDLHRIVSDPDHLGIGGIRRREANLQRKGRGSETVGAKLGASRGLRGR